MIGPLFRNRLCSLLLSSMMFIISSTVFVFAGDGPPPQVPQKVTTRTVVADLLMIDENFYVVRGERGEIRIEVTSETKISETFKFGDRIKAILLPNDEAISIIRAQAGESVGITSHSPSSGPEGKSSDFSQKIAPAPSPSQPSPPAPSLPPAPSSAALSGHNNRIIIADLLMVDGSFFIVRTERGEIQIEVTPATILEEKFKFGDRIKAVVTPNDKALSVVRASADEPNSIRVEEGPTPVPRTTQQTSPIPTDSTKPQDAPPPPAGSKGKIIIADILMVDGDFLVVRGERGEIRIEITPNTKISEKFGFGDRIKAVVLPNDKAISVERASR